MVFYNQRIFIVLVAIVEVALLFVSPLAAVFLLSLLLYNDTIDYINNNLHYRLLLFYIFACSAVLGLINITKVPENDLIWYMDHFHESGTTDLLNFMKYGLSYSDQTVWKEPIYNLLVWVLNHILMDNGAAFKFSITLLNYLLLNYSILLFAKHFEMSTKYVIIGVVSMCFIPYIFTMSLHLIRQFLSLSILIFAAVRVCFYNKKDYILLLLAPFIHTTGFILLPILLFSAFDKRFSESKIWYVGLLIAVIGMQSFAGVLSEVITDEASMSYAIYRASKDNLADFTGVLSWVKISMIIGFSIISIWVTYFSDYKGQKGVRRFTNMILLLAIFVLTNLQQTELAMRFFFFFFPFTPFLIMYGVSLLPRLEIIIPFAMVLLFVFFVQYLSIGTWTYDLPRNVVRTHIYEFVEPQRIIN